MQKKSAQRISTIWWRYNGFLEHELQEPNNGFHEK